MTRLRTALNVARFIPPFAFTVAMIAPMTPAQALPTCYSRVSQICSASWERMGYASYEACMEDLMALSCPGCTSDPDSGGGNCTVFP